MPKLKKVDNSKENGVKAVTETVGKYVRAPKPLLQLNKAGGIVKSKRPISAVTIEGNKKARLAIATGELKRDEEKRKSERDLRSLYLRFKSSETAPKNGQDVYALDKSIKDVRIPRQAQKSKEAIVKYCFVEFSDEATC